MVIYLDTVLWNRLYDDKISPSKLIADLRGRQSFIAVSVFVFHELLKTFSNPANSERGQQLMAFFFEFVNQATYVVKDNFLMIPAEVRSMSSGAPVEPFHMSNEFAGFKKVVNRLASGGFVQQDREHLRFQKQWAEGCREASANISKQFPHTIKRFKEISGEGLAEFLHKESMTLDAVAFLIPAVRNAYDQFSPEQIDKTARKLLTIPAKRFARGCASAGLYNQWRFVNFGSVPKDIPEDITHILDSVYCDVYATSEAKQAEYAHMLVTTNTKIKLFQNECPIDEWIVNLTNLS
jgi:hypothetical protein